MRRVTGRVRFGTKFGLLAGFGGVLGLMALAGLDSVNSLHQIETENTEITQDYLREHGLLEQIRSSVYLASTAVRDYLTESNPEAAEASLATLRHLRDRMNSAVAGYRKGVRADEVSLFHDLDGQVGAYWKALDPILSWRPEERRAEGLQFLQTQVFPRRTVTLRIADQIDAVNAQALRAGNQKSADLFRDSRRRIVGILGLTLTFGLALATASIVRSLRLERETRLRYEEVRRAQAELKRLSARLVQAQEQERRAIARELHDEVGQALNALLLDLGNLAARMPPDDSEVRRLLDTAKRLAEESVKALRDRALMLRPSMLDDLGLVPALHWQAREVGRRTGMVVDVVADDVADDLPDEHKTCVYRVVQEALLNTSRHAEARRVLISVRQDRQWILLTIQDDGKGFDAERTRGLGLLGMQERVQHLEGDFRVQSRPGQGTVLNVELPLAAPDVQRFEAKA